MGTLATGGVGLGVMLRDFFGVGLLLSRTRRPGPAPNGGICAGVLSLGPAADTILTGMARAAVDAALSLLGRALGAIETARTRGRIEKDGEAGRPGIRSTLWLGGVSAGKLIALLGPCVSGLVGLRVIELFLVKRSLR